MGTLDIQEDRKDIHTGTVKKVIKTDIILFAIAAIQKRTRKDLGAWCNVHWMRRAPFRHAYQSGQELTLLSESPILHMNSIEGYFQGILLDAAHIPKLEIGEAGELLTMLASFLELNAVRPGGKQLGRVGMIMEEAVKNMDLQKMIREKFEAKIEQQQTKENRNREWWKHSSETAEQLEEC